MLDNKQTLTNQQIDLIRNAFKKSKRTVLVADVMLSLSLSSHEVQYVLGGVVHKRTEEWIVAKPASGALVPMYNIEREFGANIRSREA